MAKSAKKGRRDAEDAEDAGLAWWLVYGGIDDNTTACRCLVLLLLSQRQLPSASVFDPKEGKDKELLHVMARSAKKGRRELMVAGALVFGETRRKKRLRDTEGF